MRRKLLVNSSDKQNNSEKWNASYEFGYDLVNLNELINPDR